MSRDLERPVGIFNRKHSRKTGRRVGDVPTLIRALGVTEPGVADDARAALTSLAGVDLGPDGDAWRAWWRQRGPEMARREADRASAADLFTALRHHLLTGQWALVAHTLSASLRSGMAGGELLDFLRRSAPILRRAYRDASVKDVACEGNSAQLRVDWGEVGFEFRDIELCREGGVWKFKGLPWGSRTVARSAGASRQMGGAGCVVRPRRRFLRNLLVDAAIVLALPGTVAVLWLVHPPILVPAALLAVPMMFFCSVVFGRHRRARDVRNALQRMRTERRG
jgi:hypothetical protein